jgi:hypothetical protein
VNRFLVIVAIVVVLPLGCSSRTPSRAAQQVREFCEEQHRAIDWYVQNADRVPHGRGVYGDMYTAGTWVHFDRVFNLCLRSRSMPEDERKRMVDAADDVQARIVTNVQHDGEAERQTVRRAVADLARLFEQVNALPVE